MMALAIQKVGGLCPAGSLDEVFLSLENGELSDRAALAGECDAAALRELAGLLPGTSLRRVPRPAKIALRAALDAADLSSGPGALIISTAYGSAANTFEFLDSIIQDGAGLASPTAFSHSVTNMIAAFVSQGLRVTGPNLTVTQPSLTPALEAASALLASGQAASVLWGTVSERSATMAEVEKRSGLAQNFLTDGAVFFQLALPNPNRQETRLEFGPAFSACGQDFAADDDLAETLGRGTLALALRLALTSLFLEKSSTRPMSRTVTDGRERLVVSRGGVTA